MRGKKQHHLTIYRRQDVAEDTRDSDETEQVVASVIAFLKTSSGGEGNSADQQRGIEQFEIRFRLRRRLPGLDSTCWAIHSDGRRFNFRSVQNVEERNREVLILASVSSE